MLQIYSSMSVIYVDVYARRWITKFCIVIIFNKDEWRAITLPGSWRVVAEGVNY